MRGLHGVGAMNPKTSNTPNKSRRTPRRDWRHWYVHGMTALLRAVGGLPLPIIYYGAWVLGRLLFWLYPSRRRITIRNLAACFPTLSARRIRQLGRQHFHSMVAGVLSMAIVWWSPVRRLQRLVEYRQPAMPTMRESHRAPAQNCILLAPHFIGLEFLGMFLSSRGAMTSMYRQHKNSHINRFLLQKRQRFGLQLYDSRRTSKQLVQSIRAGVPFYYLPDQDPGQNNLVFAPFYGIPTATYPTLGKLAQLTDARVIPCMARLKKHGLGYEIITHAPLANYPSGQPDKDAATMNRAIEKLIAEAPEQYFWSHRRFKTRPPGAPKFY